MRCIGQLSDFFLTTKMNENESWHRSALHREFQTNYLPWFQKWFLLLVFSFGTFVYLWNWLIKEGDPYRHFPPAFVPPGMRINKHSRAMLGEYESRVVELREIEFAVIACSGNANDSSQTTLDTLAMMKSAALLTKSTIHFHIFTEDSMYHTYIKELDRWPPLTRHKVSFEFRHVMYPELFSEWEVRHRTCHSLILFLPQVMPHLSYVMFVSKNVLFLNNIKHLWYSMLDFKEGHVVGVAEDDSEPAKYGHKVLGIPYSGKKRLMTDFIMYDLNRMKNSVFKIPVARKKNCNDCRTYWDAFETKEMAWHPNMIRNLYDLFREDIYSPEQDLINVLMHFNPDKLYLIPKSWKFEVSSCDCTAESVDTCPNDARAIFQLPPCWPTPLCEKQALIRKNNSDPTVFDSVKSVWNSTSFTEKKLNIYENIKKRILKIVKWSWTAKQLNNFLQCMCKFNC